jgi:beta-N-acetylhexosaminidase
MLNLSRFLLMLAILAAILFLPATSPIAQAQTPDPVQELMSRMTVEDKVGQLFIVPFVGDNANPDSDIFLLLTEYKVGGVILLAANSNFNNDASAPRQIAELTNSLKTIAYNTNGVPLFVALDHEGDGYPYTRVTGGVAPVPSQMAIGATWDSAKAEAVGQIVGQELTVMGVNLLLGPGLDVLNDPRPTGRGDIGTRVFGGDPYWVSQMGRAYIRGVHVGGNGRVATVAKHFPGHGGSDRLPDNEVATVDKSLQELQRIELPPFFHVTADLSNHPVYPSDDQLGMTDALMSSHIRYRGFQGDIRQFTAPISFDAEGMRTLLNLPEITPWRNNGGLIISDALGVPAVRKHFDPSLEQFPHRRIAKEAFLAGNDVLSLVQFALRSLWQDQFPNIKDTIFFFRTEYLNNPTFAKQVDLAVERILRLKLKLYPQPTLANLTVDPNQTLGVTSLPRPVINEIARESLTLLYPSVAELRQRLPQSPRPDEKILIVSDIRLVRECFTDDCQPTELLARNAVQDTILRLYGPGASGQIQPEQISTITFAELKLLLGGALITPEEPATATDQPDPVLQLSAEEVHQRIQEADWIIFAALDVNTIRFSSSDALKLFLAQESGILRDKIAIVLALNAPYYLDTTEISKLTAYFAVYSKTLPHIEAAVRALFGEADFPGFSPVSVEGIGYRLVDVLAPNPEQNLVIETVEVAPESGIAPVAVKVRVGPILDGNGHIVPDETPVELRASLKRRQLTAELALTQAGMAEATLTLDEPGEVEIIAVAGKIAQSQLIRVMVLAPPTPTFTPVTPQPTETPTSTPTQTFTPTAIPSPTSTATVAPIIRPELPAPTTASPQRRLNGVDLASALGATLLAGLLGFWLGQQSPKPLSRRVRLSLWTLVGGLLAYLLYGAGWLRPEVWLFDQPDILAGRLGVAGLAFVFALIALGLSNQGDRRKIG